MKFCSGEAGGPTAVKMIPRRFQKPIDELRGLLDSFDLDEIIEKLRKGGRGPAFALEGLVKLYEDRYENLAPYREVIKRLEDQLGWYIDSIDHLKSANEMGLTPNADPKVFKFLEVERAKQNALLSDILRNDGWIATGGGHPFLKKVETQLDKTKWASPAEDHDYLAKKLQKHVEKKLIQADYDMTNLEAGLHKFRREMRWLLIYAQALNGLVVLDDRKLPKKWRQILKDPIGKSAFAQLPVTGEAKDFAIFFPKALYWELTKAVGDLGDAKDTGEAESKWLLDALHLSGAEPDLKNAKARAEKLARLSSHFVPRLETANAVEKRIRGGSLLKRLRDTFHDQREWDEQDCRKFYRKWVIGRSPE